MNDTILICGTGASGSSAILEYLACFNEIYCIRREMKNEIRKNIYSQWVKDKYEHSRYYKSILRKQLCDIRPKNSHKKLMLNNSIACYNLRGIELFDNIRVCCVLRDPRSTWIAWRTEWRNKNGQRKWSNCIDPVGAFIDSYKRCMNRFYKEYRTLQNKKNVLIINFEDFALKEETRNKVVTFFNLDDSNINKNPLSALWDFNKTIYAHYFYDKEIINRIKNELSQYCHALV